jgi:NADPH:quinone reductase-like Zn-dependent oxidoreductase
MTRPSATLATSAFALLLAAGACSGQSANDPPAGAATASEQPMVPAASIRAVRMQAFGGPEVLRVEEVERPVPGEGEMLIRVVAAAVNPVDYQIRSGAARALVGAEVPYIPGFDVSGEVVEVGPGVGRFAAGDEVFALLDLRRGGGYAEYTIVRESEAADKPANASHAEAASIPLVALTAWQALFDTADLRGGQTVLIHAGAGGVGSVAVQLARWRGAIVIATASPHNHDFLREIGADVVVDYRTQRFEDFARDVDVVLDPIGGETQQRSLEVLREGGHLVSIVGLTPAARNPGRDIRTTSILVHPHAEQLGRIADLIEAGRLRPVVTHTFPLERAAEAHLQSESGTTRGKIVFQIGRD